MREHPIPQDIVGYRFHIIGSMTLKQFGEMAGGVILALLIYSTNLVAVIKWPLIFFAVSIGAAMAFLPIAERPLDHWILAFLKAIYRPTKFYWERMQKVPDPFLYEQGKNVTNPEDELDLTPARRQRIMEYLASVQHGHSDMDQYDRAEQNKIQQIIQVFNDVSPEQVVSVKQQQKPGLKVRVRSLHPAREDLATTEQKTQVPANKTLLASSVIASDVNVPATEIVEVEVKPEQLAKNQTSQQSAVYVSSSDTKQNQGNKQDEEAASFNAALPFPSRPGQPNKLVGMILTPNNELIPDAIVEIKDEQNRVVRAIKSNALGQFFITTPLRSGAYTIHIEHDRYRFKNQEIKLENKIVEPIEIRSLV